MTANTATIFFEERPVDDVATIDAGPRQLVERVWKSVLG
jgi:hypothetical protein